MANVLNFPDAFDNAAWTKTADTVITADDTTAPDGTATADRLGTVQGQEGVRVIGVSQSATVSPAENVLSFCVKEGNVDHIWLLTADFDALANGTSWFNLNTGAVGTKASEHATSGITDVGDGWYQVYVTFSTLETLTGTVWVGMSEADGSFNTEVFGGAKHNFIWRAQLESGSTPTACAAAEAATIQGGGRVLVHGRMPKWWKEWEEPQPKETPPKTLAPRERIAELAGRLGMPRNRRR